MDRALFVIESVTFTCQFQSLPVATITWTYLSQTGGSMPLASNSKYTITSEVTNGQDYIYVTSNLTVRAAASNDAGQYVCNASNNVANLIGAISSGTGQIFVQESNFAIVTTPEDTAAVVDSSVTLQCGYAATNSSGLTLHWTKNGSRFSLAGSSQQSGGGLVTYDLEFNSLKHSDTGSYQCIAISAFYQKTLPSSNAKLVVFVPASIVSSQPNTTVTVGDDNVTFFCQVEASHTLALTWTRPDETTVLPTNKDTFNMTVTRFTLDLPDVTLANTGTYTCTANNMYPGLPPGSDSRSFYLYVQSPPRIDPAFLLKNDSENGTIRLDLTLQILEAAPEVTRENTYLNFTRYDGNQYSVMDFSFGEDHVNWTIANVDLEDEGNYTLETSNIIGSSTGTIHLDIKSPPVQFTLGVEGSLNYDPSRGAYIIVEGSSLVFNCSFQADPKPSVVWTFNGNNLMTSTKKIITSTFANTPPIGYAEHNLTILSVVQADSGNYTCEGSNLHGRGQVAKTVIVIVPPTVTAISEEVIGVETRDGSFSAISLGFTITRADPEVTLADIVWTYAPTNMTSQLVNETDIYPRLNFTMDKRSVTMRDLNLSDAGTFTLTATNEAGTHSASVNLIIHVEPELIDMGYSGNETVEKSTMSFWCVADGVPDPRIVWLHNESLILVETSHRHEVKTTVISSTNRPHLPTAINSTLTVTGVRLRDAGEYLCRVDPANIDKGRPVIPDPFEVAVYPEPIDYCKSQPCLNDGVCSNVTKVYLCTCDPMEWKGIHCEIKILKFERPVIVKNPKVDDFPALFTDITVTCDVAGTPQPNITWYRNGQLLPGQRSRTLIIEEVSLEDRGRYYCVAENFDPNNSEKFMKLSSDTVLNIKGIVQYKAELDSNSISTRRRKKRQATVMDDTIVDEIATRLSGVRLPQYNATIYSVTGDPQATPQTSRVDIIITLIAPQGSAQLKNTLFSRLQQVTQELTTSVSPANISRFDGCEADESIIGPLEPGGLSITLRWPESDLGIERILQCPCGNLSTVSGGQNISNAVAKRECGGNFTHGGEWETAFVSPCNFSSTTRRLCQVANLINMPVEAISTLDNITSNEENIGSTEIGVTTILLEALFTNVANDQSANLTTGFLTVVDNLLDADPKQIQMSQEETNSSARILEVVELVSESIPLPENKSQVIISLTSFAIAVREVNPQNFSGQIFSAALGADFNFDGDKPIDVKALMIDKSTLDTSVTDETASLSIPASVFKSFSNSSRTRITNSVFLNDALFSRRNNSVSSGLEVGGIIVAAALSNGRTVENLKFPVMLTFLKKPSLENGTDTTCRFWDFSANGGYGDWSSRGCEVVPSETDTLLVICKCNHLTNFAILLDPNPVVEVIPPPGYAVTLSALSYIGAIVSIICLIATIITYLSSKKLRDSEAGQLLVNLCLAMLGLYILYIVSLHATGNPHVCAVVGGLLHYFLLASFLSMAVEAVNLYTKLVVVIGVPSIIQDKFVLKACLIVWIVPFIIVVASEAPNWKNYVSDYFCRPFDYAFYGGLMVPFILIYIFNWVIFIVIFGSLLRKKASKANKAENSAKKKLKQNFIIALTLSLLFGLGWGVGLVATTRIPVPEISYTLQTIFVLLTCFQGLLIFIMHCVRSEEARKRWKSWVYIITCRKVSLESKKSITGHVSSDYGKGTHGKYNKFATLSTAAQGSGSQTLQRILKRELDSSFVSHSDTVIDNENSVFSPTLHTLGEEKKIDLSSDAITAPTQDIQATNPFIPIDDRDIRIEVNESALDGYENEMEMKERKLDSLALDFDGKVKSETNSLHSVQIFGNTGSELADSKSVQGEPESITNEFDILWVKNGSIGGSRSSLQAATNEKRRSRQSGLDVAQRVDLTPTSSHAELRAPGNSSAPVMANNEKTPLIDFSPGSNVEVVVHLPDENASSGPPSSELA